MPGCTTAGVTYSVGISGPHALALDSIGNLYVANADNATVEEFGAGSTNAIATFSAGLVEPFALAFDSSGNLYVADYGSRAVETFAPGSTVVAIATYSTGALAPSPTRPRLSTRAVTCTWPTLPATR